MLLVEDAGVTPAVVGILLIFQMDYSLIEGWVQNAKMALLAWRMPEAL